MSKQNKIFIGVTASVFTLLLIYLGVAVHFKGHFYSGSKINGVNVSGKTVEQAKEIVSNQLKSYKLTIKERGGKEEQISASDIGLKDISYEKIKELKDNQKSLKWISAIFNKQNSEMKEGVSYSKNLLKKRLNKLSCVSGNNITDPKSASFKYTGQGYEVVKEVLGNRINKSVLFNKVAGAINDGKTTMDLDSEDCYVKPKYTSKSKKTIETKKTLNKYVSSKVTYTFGNSSETLDGSKINNWLKVDNNLNVTLDKQQVTNYLLNLAYKYNTIGTTRKFVTASGKKINVKPGDYGWAISTYQETPKLLSIIKSGKTVTKEPAYWQKAKVRGKNDIGDTYVEVSIKKQHLWYFKNGKLFIDYDVVTGNVLKGYATPKGVYYIKYKDKDAILKGQDYSSPVGYWLPFNRGVGIHDATWRTDFGGQIYKTNGSHGCVNSPLKKVKKLFNNIEAGCPVIVH
ncbi:L,D-transpeptidase family protein [Clostridium oryzae]|uniref:L,D-TPase catalytic domain-containing protein n=1 Tax=Clostridium oryzae TaxID=1450648 RepID=A0A1V4ICR1_9CLOT|nr:L,D-transpeptidase family protein [Clostridium oryzae]OPJ57644.1 hypothetical protein CLORY_40110 [Clostridium oryzae]